MPPNPDIVIGLDGLLPSLHNLPEKFAASVLVEQKQPGSLLILSFC